MYEMIEVEKSEGLSRRLLVPSAHPLHRAVVPYRRELIDHFLAPTVEWYRLCP